MIYLKNRLSRAPVRLYQLLISIFLPSTILSGPFRGIRIVKNWTGSALLPKLLGTYESEIADSVMSILKSRATDCFLDVGCAGGYYLAIAASIRGDIHLEGVDPSPFAEKEIGKLNLKINTKIIFQRKLADVNDIINVCRAYFFPFILIDIEGGEFSLLRNLEFNSASIANANFIIEMHNFHSESYGFDPDLVFMNHDCKIIEFTGYNFRSNMPKKFNFIEILNRHELRHPNTSYLVAISKNFKKIASYKNTTI